MFYDREAKTVKIPVRIINGQIKYFYGGNLTNIKEGAIGELVLSELSITDNLLLDALQGESKIEILPTDTIIMVSVNKNKLPEGKRRFTTDIETSTAKQFNNTFIEVKLLESLFLLVRGSKKASLLPVKCKILSMDREVDSLNSAYTLISREFEPHRRSHTGNVFEKCYYKGEKNIWYPLENIREQEESKLEERLFLDFKIFHLTKDYNKKIRLNEDENILVEELTRVNEISGARIKELLENDKSKYIYAINSLINKNIIEGIE